MYNIYLMYIILFEQWNIIQLLLLLGLLFFLRVNHTFNTCIDEIKN